MILSTEFDEYNLAEVDVDIHDQDMLGIDNVHHYKALSLQTASLRVQLNNILLCSLYQP
jgi:hypothetical protein